MKEKEKNVYVSSNKPAYKGLKQSYVPSYSLWTAVATEFKSDTSQILRGTPVCRDSSFKIR